jgi:hypothetical protein
MSLGAASFRKEIGLGATRFGDDGFKTCAEKL